MVTGAEASKKHEEITRESWFKAEPGVKGSGDGQQLVSKPTQAACTKRTQESNWPNTSVLVTVSVFCRQLPTAIEWEDWQAGRQKLTSEEQKGMTKHQRDVWPPRQQHDAILG